MEGSVQKVCVDVAVVAVSAAALVLDVAAAGLISSSSLLRLSNEA